MAYYLKMWAKYEIELYTHIFSLWKVQFFFFFLAYGVISERY